MKESVKVLLTEEEVDKKIDELGAQITKDYAGKKLHLICAVSYTHLTLPTILLV